MSADRAPRRAVFLGGMFSAMLFSLSLPPHDRRLVAWFALIPLLYSLDRQRDRPGLRLWHALAFSAFLCAWPLGPLVFVAGEGRPDAVADSVSRSVSHIVDAGGTYALLTATWVLFAASAGVLLRGGFRRWALVSLPSLWVGLEHIRAELLPFSFPHLLISQGVDPASPEAQVASLVGGHGLSFLVVLVNTALALVLSARSWRSQVALTILACGVFLACWTHGKVGSPPDAADGSGSAGSLRIGVIQPGDSSPPPGDTEGAIRLARQLRSSVPDVLLFPADTLDLEGPEAELRRREFGDLAAEEHVDILVGCHVPAPSADSARILYIDARGRQAARIRSSVRPWTSSLAEATHRPDALRTERSVLGVAGDPELFVGGVARRLARQGADVLLCVGRDPRAWSRRLAVLHARMAALRAVETRRWLVRATRGGYSAFVTPRGRVRGSAPPALAWAGVERVSSPSLRTPFVRFGWLTGPLLSIAAVWFLLAALLAGRGSGEAPEPPPEEPPPEEPPPEEPTPEEPTPEEPTPEEPPASMQSE